MLLMHISKHWKSRQKPSVLAKSPFHCGLTLMRRLGLGALEIWSTPTNGGVKPPLRKAATGRGTPMS